MNEIGWAINLTNSRLLVLYSRDISHEKILQIVGPDIWHLLPMLFLWYLFLTTESISHAGLLYCSDELNS
jgi:hypothetical protein